MYTIILLIPRKNFGRKNGPEISPEFVKFRWGESSFLYGSFPRWKTCFRIIWRGKHSENSTSKMESGTEGIGMEGKLSLLENLFSGLFGGKTELPERKISFFLIENLKIFKPSSIEEH